MIDVNPDCSCIDSNSWINKNDREFTTQFTPVFQLRQKEIKESSKVNPRLSYKLRKEIELFKQEYSQSNQQMLRQLLKLRLENNTDHL